MTTDEVLALDPTVYEEAAEILYHEMALSYNVGWNLCCCNAIRAVLWNGLCRQIADHTYYFNLLMQDENRDIIYWWPENEYTARIVALQLTAEVLRDEQETLRQE